MKRKTRMSTKLVRSASPPRHDQRTLALLALAVGAITLLPALAALATTPTPPVVSGIITITVNPFNPDGSLKGVWTQTISDSNGVVLSTVTNLPPTPQNLRITQ